jgi:hypothetical protein
MSEHDIPALGPLGAVKHDRINNDAAVPEPPPVAETMAYIKSAMETIQATEDAYQSVIDNLAREGASAATIAGFAAMSAVKRWSMPGFGVPPGQLGEAIASALRRSGHLRDDRADQNAKAAALREYAGRHHEAEQGGLCGCEEFASSDCPERLQLSFDAAAIERGELA